MPEFFEVVFLADPRFPGGTSTALAAEIQAVKKAGISYALAPVKGPALRKCWPFHPEVAQQLGAERELLLDPGTSVKCTFCIIHHPTLFDAYPVDYPQIEADHLILVLHHPQFRGTGEQDYDLGAICERITNVFGRQLLVAPVGPLVRRQLRAPGLRLLQDDWVNLIDPDAWPERSNRPLEMPYHIGRHSRPHPPKWPETREHAIAAWPEGPEFKVSMLGGGDFLAKTYGTLPENWTVHEFGTLDVKDFLATLDFFVYFHSAEWVEAFGRSILEAMSTGLVCILPHHFKPLFGPAAIYCEPDGVTPTIAAFARDPARYRLQSKRARTFVKKKFGLDKMIARLEGIAPDWRELRRARGAVTVRTHRRLKPVIFMSSNGVGLGHLTRQLAIAEALPSDFEPIFFTLSQGFHLVRDAGFHAEYRPFHRATGADINRWNAALAEELNDAFAFFGPEAFVFDGNMPYEGIIETLRRFPAVKSHWIRRGFWADHHSDALTRSHHFDAVIEPGDIASAFDHGPTASDVSQQPYVTQPIIRKTGAQVLGREAAREALGLPQDKRIVGVSLGSGSNFDLTDARRIVLAELGAIPDVFPLELRSPIAHAETSDEDSAMQISKYPIYPYLAAFDAMISTCGYNSFHENISSTLPTLWVPNEAAEMDLQYQRAKFAETTGMSLILRRGEVQSTRRKLESFLAPEVLARLKQNCARFSGFEGAQEAAAYIQDYSYLRKTLPLRS